MGLFLLSCLVVYGMGWYGISVLFSVFYCIAVQLNRT